jgi:hypothetical protein
MMAMRYLYAHHRNVASLSPSSWLVLYANFIFSFSALSKQAMKLIRDYDGRSLIMCLLIAYYSCLLLLISPPEINSLEKSYEGTFYHSDHAK